VLLVGPNVPIGDQVACERAVSLVGHVECGVPRRDQPIAEQVSLPLIDLLYDLRDLGLSIRRCKFRDARAVVLALVH